MLVVSPVTSLMKDQVESIGSEVSIKGSSTMKGNDGPIGLRVHSS